jgi:hypothetical protein
MQRVDSWMGFQILGCLAACATLLLSNSYCFEGFWRLLSWTVWPWRWNHYIHFVRSESTHQKAHFHIPDNLNLQKHWHDNPKFRNWGTDQSHTRMGKMTGDPKYVSGIWKRQRFKDVGRERPSMKMKLQLGSYKDHRQRKAKWEHFIVNWGCEWEMAGGSLFLSEGDILLGCDAAE